MNTQVSIPAADVQVGDQIALYGRYFCRVEQRIDNDTTVRLDVLTPIGLTTQVYPREQQLTVLRHD